MEEEWPVKDNVRTEEEILKANFFFFGITLSLTTLRKTEVKATLAYCAFKKPVLVSLCSSLLSLVKLVAHSVSHVPVEDITNINFCL